MKKTIDLAKLPPDIRARVERDLHPRDTVMSVRVAKEDLEKWKASAEEEGVYFVEWVEEACADKSRRRKK
jgi:predicted DNA binding CopG/RHH family protein